MKENKLPTFFHILSVGAFGFINFFITLGLISNQSLFH